MMMFIKFEKFVIIIVLISLSTAHLPSLHLHRLAATAAVAAAATAVVVAAVEVLLVRARERSTTNWRRTDEHTSKSASNSSKDSCQPLPMTRKLPIFLYWAPLLDIFRLVSISLPRCFPSSERL